MRLRQDLNGKQKFVDLNPIIQKFLVGKSVLKLFVICNIGYSNNSGLFVSRMDLCPMLKFV